MGFYGNATYYLPNGIARDVVPGVITTEKLVKDAVTAEKIASKAIHGSKGTKLDDNNIHSSHIATKTIGGGDNGDIAFDTITGGSEAGQGNIAGGTIRNYNILNGTIGKEKLNTTYLETKIDSSQKTISNIDQLFEFCNKTIDNNQLSRIYINQEIKWPNNENFNIVIIPAYYLAIKFSIWTILLDTNQGKFYQIEKNDTQITNIKTTKLEGYYNIINDTITGGSAAGKGNIAEGTIQQYNMADNSIGTDQIINGNITPEKLDKIYWSSNKQSRHIIRNFAQLLEALPYDFANDGQPSLSLIYIDNISSENWTNVEPIFPTGWYISLRNYGAINLIGYRGNQGANYELKIIKDENGNTILGSQTHHKIAGGENGNIADNSIGTNQIIDGNVSEAKLANIFWRYERFQYNGENVDKGFMEQLDDFVSDETRINCDNYILTFDLSYAIQISDDVILSSGTYIGWKQYRQKSYYLNNVTTNEYWLFNSETQQIQKIKINTDDIAFDSITGGNAEGKGNIASNTINEYNVDSTIASISQGYGQIPLNRGNNINVNFEGLRELLSRKTANEKGNNILIFYYYQDDTTTNHTLSDGAYIAWQYGLNTGPMGDFICSWALWNFTNNQMFTWDYVTPDSAPEKQIWSLSNPIELSDDDKEKINNFIVRNDSPVELNTVLDIKVHLENQNSKIQFIFYHQNESYQGLPSGQYLALPSLIDNSYNNRNNLLIELNSGRIYTLRRGSNGTVVVASANGTTDISGMWQVFNYFNNTIITDDDQAEGEIVLKNYCKFTDLPQSYKDYLISGYAIKTTDNFKLDSELIILAPTHIGTYLKNNTEKTIIVTYKNSNGTNKQTINPGSTMSFDVIYGPDLSSVSQGEDTYNTAWLTKLKFTYVNTNTITCNMELSEFVSAPW